MAPGAILLRKQLHAQSGLAQFNALPGGVGLVVHLVAGVAVLAVGAGPGEEVE